METSTKTRTQEAGFSRRAQVSAVLIGMALLAACGGSPDEEIVVNTDPKTPGGIVYLTGAAFCEWRARCGSIGASQVKECTAAQTRLHDVFPAAWDPVAAVTAGHVTFDAAAGKACLDAIGAAGCSTDESDAFYAACWKAFPGAVASGGACISTLECKSGICRQPGGYIVNDGCSGTCMDYLALGDACDPSYPFCAPNSMCDPKGQTCVPNAAAGQPRSDQLADCQGDLVCEGQTPSNPGSCQTRGDVGAPCSLFYNSASTCKIGLFCDRSASLAACAALLAKGAACSDFFGCAEGLACKGMTLGSDGKVALSGICSPFLDVGDPCDPDVDESACPVSTVCVHNSKTCKADEPKGSDCTVDQCASGLYCGDDNTCQSKLALGKSCTPPLAGQSDPCLIGVCDAATSVCALQCQ